MAILVDPPRWPAYGMQWSHLASDVSLEELHEFAARLSIPRRGFEGDHYDVPEMMYDALVDAGARPVRARDLVAALHAAGLRLRHRVGDRPIDRLRGVPLGGGTVADIDLVISPRAVPDASAEGVGVLLRDGEGRFALVPRRGSWSPPTTRLRRGEGVAGAAVRGLRAKIGIQLAEEDFSPVAFHVRRSGESADASARDLLAVLAATVPDPADTHDLVDWVDLDELDRRCGEEFWWPIPAYLYEVGAWARPRRL